MGVRRAVTIGLPAALALLLVAVPGAQAALSGPRSLHDRVLEANCVLIARLTKDAEPKGHFAGALWRLDVKEVLEAPEGLTDFKGYRLNDLIPGASGVGRRAEVTTDVDALVFAQLHRARRLGGIRWCTNWIVPLRGTLEESVGPKGEWKKVPASKFVERVRAHLKEMRDPEHLLKAFRGAQGSMRPYSWHDRPPLLARLLALEDERVLPMVRKIAKDNEDERLRGLLDRYLAKHGGEAERIRLRAAFDDLLAKRAAGQLAGVENYVFPSGNMQAGRPRVQRILDAAGPLRTAGDEAYVRERLLALYEAGHTFVAGYLLRMGTQAVFMDLIEKARAWDGALVDGKPDSGALRALLETRDRHAVLVVIRIAFAQDRAADTRAALESIRTTLSVGPGVRRQPGSVTRRSLDKLSLDELRAAWQAWWRASSASLRTRFKRAAVDKVLGKDPAWD